MSETSKFNEARRLDVTVGLIKRLKMFAMKRYNESAEDGYHQSTAYWDGYMRALSHVLEAENE